MGDLTPGDDPRAEHVRLTRSGLAGAPRPRTRMTAPLVRELSPAPHPAECAERFAGHGTAFPRQCRPQPAAGPLLVLHGRSACGGHDRPAAPRLPPPASQPRRRGSLSRCGVCWLRMQRRRCPGCRRLGRAAATSCYDWGLTLERLPAPRHDDLGLDDVVLGLYDWVVAWDHAASKAWLVSTGLPETDRRRPAALRHGGLGGRSAERAAPAVPRAARRRLPRWRRPIRSKAVVARPPRAAVVVHASRHLEGLRRCAKYISPGDIFQANLSQRFEAPARNRRVVLPAAVARTTRAVRRLQELPDAAIVSASPERFLQWTLRATSRRGRSRAPARGASGPSTTRRWAGADRKRQGPRREPDDRGPDAQRPVARLHARQRPCVGAVLAGALLHGAPPGVHRRRRPVARNRRARRAAARLSWRLGDRRAQVAGDGIIAECEPSRRASTAGRLATGA